MVNNYTYSSLRRLLLQRYVSSKPLQSYNRPIGRWWLVAGLPRRRCVWPTRGPGHGRNHTGRPRPRLRPSLPWVRRGVGLPKEVQREAAEEEFWGTDVAGDRHTSSYSTLAKATPNLRFKSTTAMVQTRLEPQSNIWSLPWKDTEL